jgi:hypothetical protein
VNNLTKNFDAIYIKEEVNNNQLNSKKAQTINLKSLRKEFSEIKSIMKKTKLFINNNGQLKDNNSHNDHNKEKIERFEKIKVPFNNYKRNVNTGTNILSMNLDIKKNNQENEIKNSLSKNYLEVPIDINLNNVQQIADKNISLKQNKENYNTINLSENLEEQSISSFISK